MPKYKKKPLQVDAFQWFRPERGGFVLQYKTPHLNGIVPCALCGIMNREHGWIETVEGGMRVCPGDYVITGVMGDRQTCKPEAFKLQYDLVEA